MTWPGGNLWFLLQKTGVGKDFLNRNSEQKIKATIKVAFHKLKSLCTTKKTIQERSNLQSRRNFSPIR